MGNTEISIAGTGSWKTLTVSDTNTGEILVEKKFYKAEFDKVLEDPQYSKYCEMLISKAFTRVMSDEKNTDFDAESYEEVRAVSLEVGQEIVDPEA